MNKLLLRKIKSSIFLLFFLSICLNVCWAGMSSSNYKINSDVVGAAGSFSGSSNYHLGDTLGESVIGEGKSSNYSVGAGFWYSGSAQLGISCQASNVYMEDYSLGDPNNYSKHLFSTSERCVIVATTSTPWNFTIQSSNMTSARNNLSNTNIFLSTDGNAGSGDTVTSPTTGITESSLSDYSLDSAKTIISGNTSAWGVFYNQPTVKLTNLNSLYAETIIGTLTFTLQ